MTPRTLNIDGEKVGSRHMVYVDDIRVLLCRCDVRLLAMMALALLNSEADQSDGWISKDLLYQPSILSAKYLYQMRKNVLSGLPAEYADWCIYENNRSGGYRLSLDSDMITLNHERLKALEYIDLAKLLQSNATRRRVRKAPTRK